jgi:hypothetical protein
MGIENTKVKEGESVLLRIIGARLSSVQFVMNYLILGFDGKGALHHFGLARHLRCRKHS